MVGIVISGTKDGLDTNFALESTYFNLICQGHSSSPSIPVLVPGSLITRKVAGNGLGESYKLVYCFHFKGYSYAELIYDGYKLGQNHRNIPDEVQRHQCLARQ